MGTSNWEEDKTGESAPDFQCSDKSTGFEHVKNCLAKKLHVAAKSVGEKAARQDAQSDMAHYKKQASEWLDQSAEYVRQFDYEQTNAKVQKYIRQSPGRSLLIAGTVGLVIGAILRRR
ncbi:MAG: hypothetical protein RBR06_09485 [Desulfuromonadaceae bacterium]|nr:hypothetical protein [Desulfuromonadaceae bacterium]